MFKQALYAQETSLFIKCRVYKTNIARHSNIILRLGYNSFEVSGEQERITIVLCFSLSTIWRFRNLHRLASALQDTSWLFNHMKGSIFLVVREACLLTMRFLAGSGRRERSNATESAPWYLHTAIAHYCDVRKLRGPSFNDGSVSIYIKVRSWLEL